MASIARRGGLAARLLQQRISGVLAFMVVLAAVFAAVAPHFGTLQNGEVVISNAAILAIVAAAQGIVLITRNLDVSVGAMMGFAAYVTADFAAHHPQAGLLLPVIAVTLGGALGAINGLLVAYGRISPLIATLGTMSLYRGVTYIYAHGQEVTASRLPHWVLAFVDLRIAGVPALVLLSAIVVGMTAFFLRHLPLGRRIYAVGSNATASLFCGLRTERVVLFAYILCGVMCGFAGLLYAARVGTVTVVLASGWELSSLAAAVLGGISVAGGSGSVIGAALGAILLSMIDNGLVLLHIPEFWRIFVQGCAIVLAIAADGAVARQVRLALRAQRIARMP
ncbi:Monosaccharide-transporting ATPase [Gluconacetobacter diazotrophicus PA1 5]|uniref:ABC transporter permease n=1 Tax=Gluconacetobacter diazotrophicus TaxID=33996 RepID=UPI000173D8EA|nr:ABC transporter permease [Gluconacetobacter diazotrophicus]ACI52347.1 Monosaccharide-transporting ATPase [Gluconacetobacter diazotrophicus PA1 5]TWB05557.1 monosaccharide ABC transporter membrane protein (CUT2 family) [Gluconacetobacter diazotrophicus]